MIDLILNFVTDLFLYDRVNEVIVYYELTNYFPLSSQSINYFQVLLSNTSISDNMICYHNIVKISTIYFIINP